MAREYVAVANYDPNTTNFTIEAVGSQYYLKIGNLDESDSRFVRKLVADGYVGFFQSGQIHSALRITGTYYATNGIPVEGGGALTEGQRYVIRFSQVRRVDDGQDGQDGSVWTSGTTFPTGPNETDLHLFTADVPSGLTWKDTDGTTDLTSADESDVAQYNGTDWVKQLNIKGNPGTPGTPGARGSQWSTGDAFPTSPNANDFHVFRADVSSGLTWKDTDGTTDLTSASLGDIAQYNGTDWVKQFTIAPVSTERSEAVYFSGLATEIDNDDPHSAAFTVRPSHTPPEVLYPSGQTTLELISATAGGTTVRVLKAGVYQVEWNASIHIQTDRCIPSVEIYNAADTIGTATPLATIVTQYMRQTGQNIPAHEEATLRIPSDNTDIKFAATSRGSRTTWGFFVNGVHSIIFNRS